ncbi:MAG: type secretory pathway, ATPase PulE/Tfp pilus assembly pathway, ATPase PilB, partial [Rickettsiaceae bacterium]|nr:type secretory pathway, ATPase PulE/Tfp pilus assembly pathway, ATPase PilB [Rickettsiaceae bacterium]
MEEELKSRGEIPSGHPATGASTYVPQPPKQNGARLPSSPTPQSKLATLTQTQPTQVKLPVQPAPAQAAATHQQVQPAQNNAKPADNKTPQPTTTRSVPLGEKLLSKGLISKDQLDTALKEQRSQQSTQKKMLGAILIDMGFITESALGEILTESSGVK